MLKGRHLAAAETGRGEGSRARYPDGKRRDGLSILFGVERKLNGVAPKILQGFGGSMDVSPRASWRTTGTTPGGSLETGTPKSVEGLSTGMSYRGLVPQSSKLMTAVRICSSPLVAQDAF